MKRAPAAQRDERALTDMAGFHSPAIDFRPAPPPMSRESARQLRAWLMLRAEDAAQRKALTTAPEAER